MEIIERDFRSTVLSYVLYFKNEELNTDTSLSLVSLEDVKPEPKKIAATPTFEEISEGYEPEETLFASVVDGEIETYLSRRGNEVRENLLPYLKKQLSSFAKKKDGAVIRAAIEKDGIDLVAKSIFDFGAHYVAEWRSSKGALLLKIGEDRKIYPESGSRRAAALEEIRRYYAPSEDGRETLAVYQPEEQSIVLYAPQLLTSIDTALAISVVYPKTEYRDYIETLK